MSKESVTGLINQDHEVHRLDNLFFKEVGSAYYLQDYGLEWSFFVSERIEVPVNSFLSYMTQQATQNGIIITDINQTFENFTLNLEIQLLTEETVYLTGYTNTF